MFGSIKYNLTHLFDFRGRDARQTFWYYVLFLVMIDIVAWIVAIVPVIAGVMGEVMKAAEAAQATHAPVQQDQLAAQMMQGMGPGMASIAWFSISASLLFSLLLFAAFVRRLHDSGNPGWWAGAVLALKLITLAVAVKNIGQIAATFQAASDPAAMQHLQASQNPATALLGLLGYVGPLIVIVFGVMSSTDGPNRYGEEPVSF